MDLQEWLESDLARDIWVKKYQFDNETLDEFFNRVSGGNEVIKQLMIQKKFLPAGRILANRGLHKHGLKVTYSNCYVIKPPEDNIESIFETASRLARTFSFGGGCGIDIGNLAPRGARVNNTAKQTTGSVSFMDLYSMITDLIGQSGRRGALMISIPCDHPDLEEFIDVKNDLNRVTKANISIRVTDKFLKAIEKDEDYELVFLRPETDEIITKMVNAREIFRKFAYNNWAMAEPAFLYWDRINEWNLLSEDNNFSYAGVNPCAEEPLPAGGSCLLSSINLSEFVKNPFTPQASFDSGEFYRVAKEVTTFMNELLDEGLPLHPLQEQRDSVRDWRQIGIGIMGLSDMFIKMGIKYGSYESIVLSQKIGGHWINAVLEQSALLAKEYGTYPNYNAKAVLKSPFLRTNAREDVYKLVMEHGLRNSQLLTIAPTGSLSTMLGISGGIEPIFSISYNRKTMSLHDEGEVTYKVYTPIAKEYMDAHGITEEEDLPEFFVTAMSLGYEKRIQMQGVWQDYIDASISSTVNVPEDFTVEQVEDLYIKAWKRGLKGITIFRDNCFRLGILTLDDKKEEEEAVEKFTSDNLPRGVIMQVSDDLIGKKRKLITGCGSLHVSAFFDPVTGDLAEVFLSKGSTGGCNNNLTGLSRMISLSARAGVRVEDIADQLNSTGACPSYAVRTALKQDTSKGSCCPVAIGKILIELHDEVLDELGLDDEIDIMIANAKTILKSIPYPTKKEDNKFTCPSCGEKMVAETGCFSCKSCGYSKC